MRRIHLVGLVGAHPRHDNHGDIRLYADISKQTESVVLLERLIEQHQARCEFFNLRVLQFEGNSAPLKMPGPRLAVATFASNFNKAGAFRLTPPRELRWRCNIRPLRSVLMVSSPGTTTRPDGTSTVADSCHEAAQRRNFTAMLARGSAARWLDDVQ
jgi:hypothetical protein